MDTADKLHQMMLRPGFQSREDQQTLLDGRHELLALRAVYEAARGLCYGHDWNEGTQAKLHGYRNKLIKAVDAIEKLPDAAGVAIST